MTLVLLLFGPKGHPSLPGLIQAGGFVQVQRPVGFFREVQGGDVRLYDANLSEPSPGTASNPEVALIQGGQDLGQDLFPVLQGEQFHFETEPGPCENDGLVEFAFVFGGAPMSDADVLPDGQGAVQVQERCPFRQDAIDDVPALEHQICIGKDDFGPFFLPSENGFGHFPGQDMPDDTGEGRSGYVGQSVDVQRNPGIRRDVFLSRPDFHGGLRFQDDSGQRAIGIDETHNYFFLASFAMMDERLTVASHS